MQEKALVFNQESHDQTTYQYRTVNHLGETSSTKVDKGGGGRGTVVRPDKIVEVINTSSLVTLKVKCEVVKVKYQVVKVKY